MQDGPFTDFVCSMAKPRIQIIYEDSDIVVLNKPAGVSVTSDRSGALRLIDVLAGQLSAETAAALRLVHRLDKDTSGVMLLAKNRDAQSLFCGYFEKKLVKKTYLAIVSSVSADTCGTINAPLAPNRKNPAIMVVSEKGKPAVTHWRLLADFGALALLAVNPVTDRTHQIRVHLNSIGLPLAVDPLYGGSAGVFLSDFKPDYTLAKNKTEKPLIDRLTLHAYRLSIVNNQSQIANEFVAPLEKKFAAAVKMLTKHNPKGPAAFLETDDFSKILNARILD